MTANGRKNADTALLAALAGGARISAAAEHAGISERTARRRLANSAFREELTAARTEYLTSALSRLAAASGSAALTLHGLLEAESETVRLAAARAILDSALKAHVLFTIEERMRVLEDRLGSGVPHARYR